MRRLCFPLFSSRAVWITPKSSWKTETDSREQSSTFGANLTNDGLPKFIPLFNFPLGDDWMGDFSNSVGFFYCFFVFFPPFVSVSLWSSCKAAHHQGKQRGPPASATCPQETLPRKLLNSLERMQACWHAFGRVFPTHIEHIALGEGWHYFKILRLNDHYKVQDLLIVFSMSHTQIMLNPVNTDIIMYNNQ